VDVSSNAVQLEDSRILPLTEYQAVTAPDSQTPTTDQLECDIERAADQIGEMDRQVALHEAGHAVAAYEFEWEIGQVSIDADGESDGTARMKSAAATSDLGHAVQVLLAGIAAQCIDAGCAIDLSRRGGEQDMRQIAERFAKDGTSPDDRAVTLRDQGHAVEQLLQRNWTKVQALMTKLLAKRTLSGPETVAILKAPAVPRQ